MNGTAHYSIGYKAATTDFKDGYYAVVFNLDGGGAVAFWTRNDADRDRLRAVLQDALAVIDDFPERP